METVWDTIVIGAGAAGLLAAARAAECGQRVLLLEKNRKPGVKILMSGGTRCNLTHATDAAGIVAAYGKQGRFLHSALAALGPSELVQLIEAEGVATKVEATGKIFPVSDRAADVLDALLRIQRQSGAELLRGEAVAGIERGEDGFRIATATGAIHLAQRVIVTTGGKSYPGCGTCGDGYAWAEHFGHTVTRLRPALVPITVVAEWVKSLRGITIPDVELRLRENAEAASAGNAVGEPTRGSLLFAHFGLTGPVALDLSRHVALHPRPRSLELLCDFLPAVSRDELERELRELVASDGKRQVAAALSLHLPRRLVEALLQLAAIPPDRQAAALSRVERAALLTAIKSAAIPVSGTLGFEKAEVTTGGVALDEVDSRTMQSKLVAGLYFAGEILDLDGPIGGYNFQAAFSTGWLAGQSG